MFEGSPAGYLKIKGDRPVQGIVDFMPYRSLAHLRLEEAIANHGYAVIVLKRDGLEQRMKATAIEPRQITVQVEAQ